MTGLTGVSLFAGIGGIDLALHRAGVDVKAAVEIDPACRGVIRRHFPQTTLFNDVTEVTGEQLLAAGFIPDRGILTGGFPCQDLSVAGRRAGLRGDRSSLFWEIIRIAMEIRPKWILLENVPGLLSSEVEDGDHRCICGWSGGWGGLHLRHGLQPVRVGEHFPLPGGGSWDDPEGPDGSQAPASNVWRLPVRDAGGDREMGRGVDLEGAGPEGRGGAGRLATSPDDQGRAGSASDPRGGDPAGTPARGPEASPVDARSARAVRGDQEAHPGTEPERTGDRPLPPAAVPRGETSCPACGRDLGDAAGRPVLRPGMGTVLGALAEIGFHVAARTLDAQFFGVPQRRRRVFIAGCLGDGTAPVEVLLEPEGGSWNPAAGGEAGQGSPRGAQGLPGSAGVVAATLQGGGRRGHRIDAEGAAGGHLVPVPVALRGRDGGSNVEVGEPGDPAFTVRTPGGGSSYPMIAQAMAFNPQTGGSKARLGYGEIPTALQASQVTAVHVAATLSAGTATGEGVRPPGRRQEDDVNLVAVQAIGGEVTHALTSEGADASEDGTGRGTPIVAYALTSRNDRNDRNDREENWVTAPVVPDVAGVSENQRGEVLETPYSRQLTTGGGKPGQGYGAVRQDAAVRRLTPMECERLQGFPDDWTRWLDDGTEQSDSARYRRCGNAVAVPVVQWIADGVVAVDRARGGAAEGAA